jgi:hypothetical protein
MIAVWMAPARDDRASVRRASRLGEALAEPLAPTLGRLVDFDQLGENVREQRLALGVVATPAHSNRSVVFHQGGIARHPDDPLRVLPQALHAPARPGSGSLIRSRAAKVHDQLIATHDGESLVVGFPHEKPCLIPMSRRPAGGILGRLRIIGDYQCVPSIGKWPTHLFAGRCGGRVSARAMLVTSAVR